MLQRGLTNLSLSGDFCKSVAEERLRPKENSVVMMVAKKKTLLMHAHQ